MSTSLASPPRTCSSRCRAVRGFTSCMSVFARGPARPAAGRSQTGKKVADFGCGVGVVTRMLAQMVGPGSRDGHRCERGSDQEASELCAQEGLTKRVSPASAYCPTPGTISICTAFSAAPRPIRRPACAKCEVCSLAAFWSSKMAIFHRRQRASVGHEHFRHLFGLLALAASTIRRPGLFQLVPAQVFQRKSGEPSASNHAWGAALFSEVECGRGRPGLVTGILARRIGGNAFCDAGCSRRSLDPDSGASHVSGWVRKAG
jgi:hypothetical protein